MINLKLHNTQNPYLKGAEGRKEWNDRYMNMTNAIRHWRYAFFCSLIIIIIFSLVVAKLALSTKVQPFIVETSHGMPIAIKSLKSGSVYDHRLINFAINQFIINARTVLSDISAEKTLLNKVYAFSANETITYLQSYYQKNNPFDLALDYSVTVRIVNSLPIGKDTWQVVWDEEKRSRIPGSPIQLTRWMAHLTYKLGDINQQFMMDNPFGFYITQVSWSQSQN